MAEDTETSSQENKTIQASWQGEVLAESNQTILIEGNHYFPPDSVNKKLLEESDFVTICPWKGEAHYFHLKVHNEQDENAAWYYPQPKPDAIKKVGDFSNYVAFWNNVEVKEKK